MARTKISKVFNQNVPQIASGILVGAILAFNLSVAAAAPGFTPPEGDVTPNFTGVRSGTTTGWDFSPTSDDALFVGGNSVFKGYLWNRGNNPLVLGDNVKISGNYLDLDPTATTYGIITSASGKPVHFQTDVRIQGKDLDVDGAIRNRSTTNLGRVLIDDHLNINGNVQINGNLINPSTSAGVTIDDSLNTTSTITATGKITGESLEVTNNIYSLYGNIRANNGGIYASTSIGKFYTARRQGGLTWLNGQYQQIVSCPVGYVVSCSTLAQGNEYTRLYVSDQNTCTLTSQVLDQYTSYARCFDPTGFSADEVAATTN